MGMLCNTKPMVLLALTAIGMSVQVKAECDCDPGGWEWGNTGDRDSLKCIIIWHETKRRWANWAVSGLKTRLENGPNPFDQKLCERRLKLMAAEARDRHWCP